MPLTLEERDPPLLEPSAVALAYAEQVMAYVKHYGEDPSLSGRQIAENVAGSILSMLEGNCMTLPQCEVKPQWGEEREAMLKKHGMDTDPIAEVDIGQDLRRQFERCIKRDWEREASGRPEPGEEPATMHDFAKLPEANGQEVQEGWVGSTKPVPRPPLDWGQTPFMRMSRPELELHASRLYDALTSVYDKFRSAISLSLIDGANTPFVRAALARGAYAIEQVQSGYDVENIYHCFFRYAEPLLYKGADAAIETTWRKSTSPVDHKLYGLTPEQRYLQPYSGYGYRDISWDDLKPKKT